MSVPSRSRRYNNENRWYIEKYQTILSVFEEGEAASQRVAFASTDAADPYLWLEEIDSARALNWVRAKNAETIQKLASQPIYQELRSEALAALDAPSRLPDVEQMGPWIYNLWKDDAHPRGIYRRATLEEFRKPEPAWQTVLDIDELSVRENTPWVFHGMDRLPPEYRKCLLSLSPGGGDADEVREFDPETRAFVPGGFSVPVAKTSIAWRDVDSVFLGTDFGPGSMTASGYPRQVRLWTRGTPRARATTLYETNPKSVGATGFRLRSDGGDVDLVADNRTFYETDYYQLLTDGSLHPLELPATAQIVDVYAGRLIISLKDDWQRGERKFARDSILLADPTVLRATGEGARRGGLDVLAESTDSEVVLRRRGGEKRDPRLRAGQRAGSSLPVRECGVRVDAAADSAAGQREPRYRVGGWHERRRVRYLRGLRDAAHALLRGGPEPCCGAGEAAGTDLRRQPLRGEPALGDLGRRHAGALLPGGAEGHDARRRPADAHLLVWRLP